MPDNSVWMALISTSGTLGGVLGGGILTHWLGLRRDRQQAAQQRQDRLADVQAEEAEERKQACYDLLKAVWELRLDLDISAQRQWPDMSLRLRSVRDHASMVGQQAARVAIASPGLRAEAARALADETSTLASYFTKHARLGTASADHPEIISGVLDGVLDFSAIDAKVAELHRVLEEDAQ